MYSPKILPELVEKLYHLAKARCTTQTGLVNQWLRERIKKEEEKEQEQRQRLNK